MLLSRNSDLFIQLFWGFYLGCSSGTEQFLIVQSFLSLPVLQNIHPVPQFLTLHQFITVSNMFKANVDFNLYQRLILRLKNVCLSNVDDLPLLAFFILFDFGPQNLNGMDTRCLIYKSWQIFKKARPFNIQKKQVGTMVELFSSIVTLLE